MRPSDDPNASSIRDLLAFMYSPMHRDRTPHGPAQEAVTLPRLALDARSLDLVLARVKDANINPETAVLRRAAFDRALDLLAPSGLALIHLARG